MTRLLLLSLLLAFTYVNFAEAAPGTVSGTVRRTVASIPVVGAQMYLCTADEVCSYASTDAAGAFSFTVDPGTYYLFTDNSIGMIDEIYNNIQCPGYCHLSHAIASGTAIVVTSGGTASGKDFSLANGGTIAGIISNSATTLAMPGVVVDVYTFVGGQMIYSATAVSGPTGLYGAGGLPSGTYYAQSRNGYGLIDEIYDNHQCPGLCNLSALQTLGTPIAVTAGAITTSRNFALSPGGSVTGTVRNSATSAPLQNVLVWLRSSTSAGNAQAGAALTNASGVFTVGGLSTGTYYAYTTNELGFINEYFDNIPCPSGCTSSAPAPGATPIAVTGGAVTSGRDFALDAGGIITGTVVTSTTSAAVANVTVTAYALSATGSLEHVRNASTNASGVYTINSLPTGSYYLATYNAAGLVNEAYDNIQCIGSCNDTWIATGTPVSVSVATTVSDRNFALQPGGTIAGTVSSQAGSALGSDSYVWVVARDPYQGSVNAGYSPVNGSGAWAVGGLPSGAYWVYTQVAGHRNEIYSDIPCVYYCDSSTALSAGTSVSVTAGATTGGIDISLATAGRITGVVRNAATSAAIAGTYVYAYRILGGAGTRNMGSGLTDSSGTYTIGGLPTGDYFVATQAEGFRNQVHAGLSCAVYCSGDLAVARGTPIHVSSTGITGAVDFSLTAVGATRITGTLRDASTSAPVADTYVYAYTRNGADFEFANYGYTNGAGVYQIAVPPGTYYLATPSDEYQGEIYDNIPCFTHCLGGAGAIALGTPVTLTAGTVTADFMLQPPAAGAPGPPDELWGRVAGGTVKLEWYESEIGGKPTDYVLEVGLSPGTTFASLPVAGNRFQASGVPPGRYFLRVRGRNSSGVGPASGEFDLTVNADGSGAPGDPYGFILSIEGSRLYASWAEPWNGGYPTDYVLEAGTATGLSNIGTFPVGSRSYFEIAAPPPGVYFARVRGRNALSVGKPSNEFMLVVGGVPAPPDAPGMIGFGVDPARRVTLGWATPRGTVTGYVVQVGSAADRYDLATLVLPASPTMVTTPGPMAPGIYFVRMRSINASGVGTASSERILIVP